MASLVEVSPFDWCKYCAFTLPNQLKFLVISDPLSKQAAVSMDVAVGSFSNPKNLQGLAHFVEHMLFLGNEKYPEEGSFDQFIAENGGNSNAQTMHESTNYQFHIVAAEDSGSDFPKCKEALDRFSHFFLKRHSLWSLQWIANSMQSIPSFNDSDKNLFLDAIKFSDILRTLSTPFRDFKLDPKSLLEIFHVAMELTRDQV